MINIKNFLAILLVTLSVTAFSQDTTRKKTIDITSSFKPVLKEAAKINFNAAPPAADGRRPVLQYNVPSQNLLLGYQPVPIQPVALQADSTASWKNSNYIKVGIGNVTVPYVQAGLSFGDSKSKFYNIFANHYSSKGSLPFQKNNRTEVEATATYKTPSSLEWNGKLGFISQQYFLYGYRPATIVFTKDQLRQRFQTFGGKLSLRNMEPTEYGINYNPNIKISVFSGSADIDKATEANAVLNVPVQKTINENFAVNLGITADITNFRPRDTATIQNNLYYVSPAVVYTKDNLNITAGIIPSWENKKFSILPNIMADIHTAQNFTIQLGWIGYYNKGSYERFASINPWLSQPKSLLNTRVHEIYGGLKGTLAEHFTYSAKLSYLSYRNMPLFVNDSIDGKTFDIQYVSTMQSVQIHGEVGYIQGENLNASAFLTFNNYSIKKPLKAYGLQPLEMGASLRWQAIKNLWLNSDLTIFSGAPYYITSTKTTRSGKSGLDLSAGVEYKIAKQVNLWFQMNNVFNNKYERWNQYHVYGFNVLGGIIFSFDQK